MVDFRAELAALVAAYDIHRKWTINAVFERLRQAVEHARDVLAQPEPAPAAVGEAEELAKWLYYLAAERTCNRRRGIRPHPSNLTRAADLLERQALRPIPVSERLPEKAEMTDDDEVWVEYPGGEYPLGDTGDYDWEPHKWILSPIAKFTIRENRRWLPAHALPLPEVE